MKKVRRSEDQARPRNLPLWKAMAGEGYKQDWIKFLIYAVSSNDETSDHLETLWDTKSLTNETVYTKLHHKIQSLGKMTNSFLKTVEEQHVSAK
ncbi:MAG: intervening sequence, rRNA [Chitinophagaceae bacterium]|nr:intervening sequence, rRNA [Chitinophagaceae bacterium]